MHMYNVSSVSLVSKDELSCAVYEKLKVRLSKLNGQTRSSLQCLFCSFFAFVQKLWTELCVDAARIQVHLHSHESCDG